MSCNAVQATKLLRGKSVPENAEDVHETVVEIVMGDGDDVRGRVRNLMNSYFNQRNRPSGRLLDVCI